MAPSPTDLLHAAITTATLVMALWTVRMDLKYFYGWQQGAWMFKFTHWSMTSTLAYLVLSFFDILTGYGPLGPPRRWLLLTTTVLAVAVDTGFFGFIFPKRLNNPPSDEPILSVTSAHKHAINLLWILADAGSRPHAWPAPGILAVEITIFTFIVPMIVTTVFYRVASILKDEETGADLLNFVGVPLPDPDEEYDEDVQLRGNNTAIPGHWIYASFKHPKLRTLFVLSPLIYGPVSLVLLLLAHNALNEKEPTQLITLALILFITPALYLPEVWKKHKVEIIDAVNDVATQVSNMGRGAKYLLDLLMEFAETYHSRAHTDELQSGFDGVLSIVSELTLMMGEDLGAIWHDLVLLAERIHSDVFGDLSKHLRINFTASGSAQEERKSKRRSSTRSHKSSSVSSRRRSSARPDEGSAE